MPAIVPSNVHTLRTYCKFQNSQFRPDNGGQKSQNYSMYSMMKQKLSFCGIKDGM